MRSKNKLIYGWGISDVEYPIYKVHEVGGKRKIFWSCHYYQDWCKVMQRVLSKIYHAKNPTYADCTIDSDWKYLSNFIKWVDNQPNKDWRNCQLDKDLLVVGNKHYSPDTCIYLPKNINSFITNARKDSQHMVGVTYRPNKSTNNPYYSTCSNPLTKAKAHVGCFPTEIQAHKAWQAKKHEHACMLADTQKDECVVKALRERYAPDKDWTKV